VYPSPGQVIESIKRQSRPEDIVILSVHWGGNWGYSVPEEQINFAHRLLDSGAVDAVHGHSSHHVRPLEVYRGKLIVYGAGDFLNDYEGITGAEDYRGDLTLMYFPTFDSKTGCLTGFGWSRFRFSGSACDGLQRLMPLGSAKLSTGRAAVSEHESNSRTVNSI
jgi:hypothetical protein